jgi:hypothetical protein
MCKSTNITFQRYTCPNYQHIWQHWYWGVWKCRRRNKLFSGSIYFSSATCFGQPSARGFNLANLFLGGYKYGNLAFQDGRVSDEAVKYGYGFCATRTIECLYCKLQIHPLVREGVPQKQNSSLDIWTVVNMTPAKFKPFVFPMSGFALSNIGNIFVVMILYDFCLLPAWFCYVFVNVRNLESHMHIDRCAPCKTVNGAKNLNLQTLQFQYIGFCRKFPGGTSVSHYRSNQGFVEC